MELLIKQKRKYGPIEWDIDTALSYSKSRKNLQDSSPDDGNNGREKNYELSYIAIRQFAECEDYDSGRLRLLLNLVYGWMPRIARIIDEKLEGNIIKGLNLIRHRRPLTKEQLHRLVSDGKAYMGSVVGFSKMLHFVADDTFAIFDSRVLSAFVPFSSTELEGTEGFKKDYSNYKAYLQRAANDVDTFIGYNLAMNKYCMHNRVSLRSIEKQLFGSAAFELGG